MFKKKSVLILQIVSYVVLHVISEMPLLTLFQFYLIYRVCSPVDFSWDPADLHASSWGPNSLCYTTSFRIISSELLFKYTEFMFISLQLRQFGKSLFFQI